MAETRNVMLKQSNIVIDFHLSFLMRGNRPHLLYLQNHPHAGLAAKRFAVCNLLEIVQAQAMPLLPLELKA